MLKILFLFKNYILMIEERFLVFVKYYLINLINYNEFI